MPVERYTVLRGRPSGTGGAIQDARIEVMEMSERQVAEIARDPAVVEFAPIMPMDLIDHCAAGETADPECADRNNWGVSAVGADVSDMTGAGVTVAVIDTGIDKKHPAFDPFRICEKDFTGSGNGDVLGHGTHCAGTIFGWDCYGKRIGIAKGIKRALIAKVKPDTGPIQSDMVFEAMMWAVRERADIISISLGFDYPGMVAKAVVEKLPMELAVSRGLIAYRKSLRLFDAVAGLMEKHAALDVSPLIVAAAGNQSRRHESPDFRIGASLPAAATGVVSVAALARAEGGLRVANFTNVLPTIAGPGVNILSAWKNGELKCSSGTSCACPHVAGVAALWLEKLRQGKKMVQAKRLAATLIDNARKDLVVGGYDPSDVGAGVATAPRP
jgi:subtilisin family serine protease